MVPAKGLRDDPIPPSFRKWVGGWPLLPNGGRDGYWSAVLHDYDEINEKHYLFPDFAIMIINIIIDFINILCRKLHDKKKL